MIQQLIFRYLPLRKKVNFLHAKGVSLGSRSKNGRRIYVYMLNNLFVEVMYKNDDVNGTAEHIHILRGLTNLNNYLEEEFKTSF